MRSAVFFALAVIFPLLTGCAGNQLVANNQADQEPTAIEPLGFAPISGQNLGETIPFPGPRRGLAGRTLQIESIEDIVLMRGEVVLTFDDGPIPGRTISILDTLDRHGVKATFLMVGQMARSYPHLVREVAARGHTIGSHSQNHPNLAAMSHERAIAEILAGERSIAQALVPTRHSAAPFFRFPYLAETPALRRHLAERGTVVIDVDVDSKDYWQSTPDQVRRRTLSQLERRGSGIILFHDLHRRTATMLPSFLAELDKRGYRVVHLAPATPAVIETAGASIDS
jgi:peptidoglycan-N-acetylglucosamine deacetylase